MKFSFLSGRGARISLSFLFLTSLYARAMGGEEKPLAADMGLLPIERSQQNRNLIDELFNPGVMFPMPLTPGGPSIDLGTDDGDQNNVPLPNRPNRPNVPNRPPSQNRKPQITRALVPESFRCNLFENTPYEEILSAVNILNQAVNSPNCADSRLNIQSIVENNKIIVDALEKLRGFKDNPETVRPENATDIVTKTDAAIRAASTVANSFAQTDLLKKECREAMGKGDVAVAVSDLLNGLSPYALMAATMTGGTAAVPFIVGGTVITSAVSSMAKLVSENTANIRDVQVRRAIVENTCQFIRIDQKYKFLIKSRHEQISRITEDISASQQLFSAKVEELSGETNGLINRKNALEKAGVEITEKVSGVSSQLELDKQFMNSTSDNVTICQLGIQLSYMAQNNTSYVSTLLGTLDEAMIAYGTTNIAQAQALKSSATIAINHLQGVAAAQFGGTVDFNLCAQATKSFVETIDRSSSLAKQLIQIGQENIEKSLRSNQDYSLFRNRLFALDQKREQADLVTASLDNLKASATAISQSEISSEMSRLRRTLFHSTFLGSSSPVLQWFKYVKGLHTAQVRDFQEGLRALRMRALRMINSVNAQSGYPMVYQRDMKRMAQNQKDANDLTPFNLNELPLGTPEHDGVCRELNDVWNRWVVAVDHLAAMDAFCSMIEPYIYDTRPEDRELVSMCRGFTKASGGVYGDTLSVIAQTKNALVNSGARDWALFIEHKMESLVCLDGPQNIQ